MDEIFRPYKIEPTADNEIGIDRHPDPKGFSLKSNTPEIPHRKRKGSGKAFSMTSIYLSFLIISCLVSGCTARIVSRPADDHIPAVGIAYHLPATELSYVMTFRLTDCQGAIEMTDAAIEQRAIPDRGAGTYLIDSSEFGNLSKTIPLAKISIANGMLTSISYDAKDRTADIIKGGANLLGDMASAVSPVNLSSLGGALRLFSGSRSLRQDRMVRTFQLSKSPQEGKASTQSMCNQATQDMMDEYVFLLQHLKTMKQKLYAAENQLIEKRDGVADRIQDMENVIKRTRERLADLDKHLTLQYRKPLIIESGKCEGFGDIMLESPPFTKWFGDKGDNDRFRRQFQAWIDENKLSYTISNCNAKGKGKMKTVEGLYYRIPAQCKLEITRDTLISANTVELMQCGRLAALEITNGAFQDNSHRIEFDPLSGEIRSFEFKDNTVRASEALSGMTEAAKTAGGAGK